MLRENLILHKTEKVLKKVSLCGQDCFCVAKEGKKSKLKIIGPFLHQHLLSTIATMDAITSLGYILLYNKL